MKRSRHVFISCGEASGDRYGAALTAALRARVPDLRVSALGGSQLRAAGADVVLDADELAVMGLGEVVRALPAIWRAQRRLRKFLVDENVDMFIPIDFPGFNARLAGHARRRGVPVFWLIAPQLWAWGGWRAGGYRGCIDRLGTILPFETEFFRQRGFDVFPMGHPLLEDYGATYPFAESLARREAVLTQREVPVAIGILPGSRRQELDRLLPVLKVTAQAIAGHLGQREVRFLVSVASGVDPVRITEIFDTEVELHSEPLVRLLPRLDLALVCSGTASLEVALAGVPHELVYRTGALTAFWGRRLVRTPYLGLSNIILDKKVVREHLQDDASPLPLARNLLRWMARPAERQEFYGHVKRLRQMCGEAGVWDRTAAEILAQLTTGTAPALPTATEIEVAVQKLKLLVTPLVWRALACTIRLERTTVSDDTAAGGVIFACLHRDILPALLHVRPARPTLLVSGSADGDILVRSLGRRHYDYVRGATGEDGGRALVHLRRALDSGRSVGLAVDGPKGPFGEIRDGVLKLGRLTGSPILPLLARPRRAHVLGTWDRTVVPLPFSRVEMLRGPQLRVGPSESDMAAVRRQLKIFFALGEERS